MNLHGLVGVESATMIEESTVEEPLPVAAATAAATAAPAAAGEEAAAAAGSDGGAEAAADGASESGSFFGGRGDWGDYLGFRGARCRDWCATGL